MTISLKYLDNPREQATKSIIEKDNMEFPYADNIQQTKFCELHSLRIHVLKH